MNKLALFCAAVAVGQAAPGWAVGGSARIDVTFQPIRVPASLFVPVAEQLDPSTLQGRMARELEQTLDLIAGSAETLAGELSVLGTSADEQAVQTFGDSGAGGDQVALFGVLPELDGGRRYRLTLSFAPDAPLPAPGDYAEFDTRAPVRSTGDPSLERLIVADFTAPLTRGGPSLFLLLRPGGLPAEFRLGGINISAAVPEPARWAMMVLGFGVVGIALRRRRTAAAA